MYIILYTYFLNVYQIYIDFFIFQIYFYKYVKNIFYDLQAKKYMFLTFIILKIIFIFLQTFFRNFC
ncbi:hypothetical protein BLD25_05005 [Candidatus Gracilibacteria bacterium GN02-872]|nr:hypothetical protein BLD25_05005 [Candidatus Gracilibacteria bacterium GN02-872]